MPRSFAPEASGSLLQKLLFYLRWAGLHNGILSKLLVPAASGWGTYRKRDFAGLLVRAAWIAVGGSSSPESELWSFGRKISDTAMAFAASLGNFERGRNCGQMMLFRIGDDFAYTVGSRL